MDTTISGPIGELQGGSSEVLTNVPHVCIVWSLNEPTRVGEVAAVTGSCLLGRGSVQPGDDLPRLEFNQQRPGRNLPTGALTDRYLSRRQLVLRPEGTAVSWDNLGRRRVLLNGVEAQQDSAQPGDTIQIEGVLVLLVATRPRVLPKRQPYVAADFDFGSPDSAGFIGETSAAWELRRELAHAARSRAHVLLQGPSGSGKELCATVVYRESGRKGPFVARNAATIPESLIDAELFGTARNYPNVGSPEREGLIGAADGGALFLDEVGEMSHTLQAHLLRVLDCNGEYQRLGETRSRKSDLRVIAATNRDLSEVKHDFRARFALQLRVPSFQERKADVPLIVRLLFDRLAEEDPDLKSRFCDVSTDGTRTARLAPNLMEALVRHSFTENARELERLLRTAALGSIGNVVELTEQTKAAMQPQVPSASNAEAQPPEVDKQAIEEALIGAGGCVTKAAQRLGVSRFSLYRLMRRFEVRGG